AAILHAVRADQFCITLDRQVAYLGMIDDISLSGFQSAAGNHCLRIVGRAISGNRKCDRLYLPAVDLHSGFVCLITCTNCVDTIGACVFAAV
ncbi:hypothetical protein BCGKFG_BCGKFG_09205, partial [Dysosmobacter welbionis]